MTESMVQAKKDFSRFSIGLLVITLVTAGLQFLLSFLMNTLFDESPLEKYEILLWILTMAPMYLIAVPMGFLLIKKIPAEHAEKHPLSFGRFLVLMLMCMPIMYGGNLIGTLLSALLSGGTAQNALEDYLGNPLYSFLFAAVLAPFLEEFIFRKQIIDRLSKYGELPAILFSAVTFGLFHTNLFQFFYAFGLGLIFAYVYARTRMLRYPVIMHMIINTMGGVIAPMLLSLVDPEIMAAAEAGTATAEQLVEILPGMLALLGYVFVLLGSALAGLILLIIRWKKRQFEPAPQQLPWGTSGKIVYGSIGTIAFCVVTLGLTIFSVL